MMNKTPNYQLNQWARADRVLMEDFNADNAKIDAAIKAVDQRVSALSTSKADKTALAAAETKIPRIITGKFTGTGSADPLHITIGARPRLLLIATNNTIGNSNERARFVTENGISIWFSHQNNPVIVFDSTVTLTNDGFTITFTESPDRSYNRLGYEQRYWALC